MSTIRLISKLEQLKRNVSVLVQDLLTRDGILDLDDETARQLAELKYIEIKYSRYDLTPEGKKEFMRALKEMGRRLSK